jgi:hypothetical protein
MTNRRLVNRAAKAPIVSLYALVPVSFAIMFGMLLVIKDIVPRGGWHFLLSGLLILGIVPQYVALRWARRRIRCPRCSASLYDFFAQSFSGAFRLPTRVRYCPVCALDFDAEALQETMTPN